MYFISLILPGLVCTTRISINDHVDQSSINPVTASRLDRFYILGETFYVFGAKHGVDAEVQVLLLATGSRRGGRADFSDSAG